MGGDGAATGGATAATVNGGGIASDAAEGGWPIFSRCGSAGGGSSPGRDIEASKDDEGTRAGGIAAAAVSASASVCTAPPLGSAWPRPVNVISVGKLSPLRRWWSVCQKPYVSEKLEITCNGELFVYLHRHQVTSTYPVPSAQS